MGSYVRKKIECLVVDTSAFINNSSLQEIGENIITVTEVINEIKSKRQIRRLVVLPYDLNIKDVYPENVKFVTDFSKKTGDYASLSATDIKVIAMTYQLEKEKVGVNHLNTEPAGKPEINPKSTVPEDLKNIAGFYVPKKNSKSEENSDDEASEYDSAEEDIEVEEDCENELGNVCEKSKFSKDPNSENEDKNNCAVDKDSDEEGSNEESEEEEDDDDEWITPSNIARIKNQLPNDFDANVETIPVACLTTDFAMQNVLKQIGLNVVSLDGKLIKHLRTFILRCYGCFKTTSVMSKVFCPNCGNKTLKKVAVSIDDEGKQVLHINFRKPLTARGKRFSLPLPKGGKHSNNPVLCEDQPMPQQRPSRLSRMKNNPLNDDYIAGYSPFVTRDVNSKSAMLGIRPHVEMKHWMRKNPNESRRKKK